jgi:carbon storage regulator
MLVLSRKPQESIQIGSDITVTVVQVAGDKVTISIDAPRNIRIIRTELLPFMDQGLIEESAQQLQETAS